MPGQICRYQVQAAAEAELGESFASSEPRKAGAPCCGDGKVAEVPGTSFMYFGLDERGCPWITRVP